MVKLKKLFKGLIIVILSVTFLYSQQSKKEIIYKVNIIGNKRIEKDAIYPYISVRPGDVFDINKIRQDVKNIYRMGYFENVLVNYHKLKQGIEITYIVVEKPYIAGIVFKGIKSLKKSDVTKDLKVKPFTVLNEELLKKDIQKIIDIYQDHGFYNVKVKYKISKPKHDKVIVTIIVNEGIKAKIKKVKFIGNKHISSREIQKHIYTRPYIFLISRFFGTGYLKKSELEKDVHRIESVYYKHGFLRVKVFDPIVKTLKGGKYLEVIFKIEEGKRYKFSKVDIIDPQLSKKDKVKLLKMLKCKKGDYFSNIKVHDDIQFLTDYYGDLGYAFADVNPITKINDEKLTVNLAFKIERGNLYKFREIHIKGNTYTRDKVIRRMLRIYEQDKYTVTGLKVSRHNLKRSGFFSEADITTKKVSDNQIDATVIIKEQPTGSFTIGGGYSSTDNFIFVGSISKNNFLGKGYNLNFYADISGSYSRYNISFTDPAILDTNVSAGFSLYNIDEDYDTYDALRKGFGFTFGAPIGNFERWDGGYYFESVKVYNVDVDAAQYIKDEEGKTTTGAITFSISKDTTNSAFFPTAGTRQSLNLELAGQYLGGDENYYKIVADSIWFKKLKKNLIFDFRIRLGYLNTYSGSELPAWERFYVGGTHTIRGFKFGKAGPRDEKGKVKGGNKEIVTNTELRFHIIKDLGVNGLVFFDMGKAYDRGEFDLDLRKSIGFGLSWRSPFGPIVIYWGFNLSPKSDESRNVVNFSMGKTF